MLDHIVADARDPLMHPIQLIHHHIDHHNGDLQQHH